MALAILTLSSAALTAILSGLRTATARWITAATIGVSTALIQVPAFAERLHLQPLHGSDWAMAVGGVLVCCVPALSWYHWRRRTVPGPTASGLAVR